MFSFPGTQKYFMEYTSEPFADADVKAVSYTHLTQM